MDVSVQTPAALTSDLGTIAEHHLKWQRAHVVFCLGIFSPEYEGTMVFHNIGNALPNSTVSGVAQSLASNHISCP